MAEKLVRVRVKLCHDHPLLKIPPKQRGVVAGYWLDIGMRLAAIEETLARMELHHLTSMRSPEAETKREAENNKNQVDVEKFLKAFDF
ncbi:MAG: hypothetical protein K6T65_10235 [Peptococcaceae bacterium]|nr:hypothetical protein [Peptococcaceae bacterium]